MPGAVAGIRLCDAMAEANPNLWAPWRSEYIHSLGDYGADGSCFLCDYATHPAEDDKNFVVCRTGGALVVMNRYPYTNGHLLISPERHVASIVELAGEELAVLSNLIRDGVKMLERAVKAHGYNIGMNLGRCAGAGLPGHLHWHVVPRWDGDTNFMSTVGSSRVIAESLEDVHARLRQAGAELDVI